MAQRRGSSRRRRARRRDAAASVASVAFGARASSGRVAFSVWRRLRRRCPSAEKDKHAGCRKKEEPREKEKIRDAGTCVPPPADSSYSTDMGVAEVFAAAWQANAVVSASELELFAVLALNSAAVVMSAGPLPRRKIFAAQWAELPPQCKRCAKHFDRERQSKRRTLAKNAASRTKGERAAARARPRAP